ncbi:MAG: copper chaperone PCu(A)C [Pseudomonadota bacterium]
MRHLAFAALAALTLAGCGGDGPSAEAPDAGGFIRLPAEGARMSAAYLTVTRDTDDRLVSASVEGVSVTELHTVLDDEGVRRMRKVEGYDVKAGEPLVLQPGGNHLMLIGLYQPLQAGEERSVTLVFESGATETVSLPVTSGQP